MSRRIASTILRGFKNRTSLDISRAFSSKERKFAANDPSIRPAQIANDGVPVLHVGRGGPLGALFDIEAWEISTGRIVAFEDFPTETKAMMEKHQVTWAEHKSVASQVLGHYRAKGRAAQAKAGWQSLARGRATQAEAGYPGLKKALATQNAKTKAADLLRSPSSLKEMMMRREYQKACRDRKNEKLAKISAQDETAISAQEETNASHSPKS